MPEYELEIDVSETTLGRDLDRIIYGIEALPPHVPTARGMSIGRATGAEREIFRFAFPDAWGCAEISVRPRADRPLLEAWAGRADPRRELRVRHRRDMRPDAAR